MEPITNIPAAHRNLASRLIKMLYSHATSTGKVPECSLGLLDLAETARLFGLKKDSLKILDSVRRGIEKSDPALFKIIFSRLINRYVRAGRMENALSVLRLTQKKEYLLRGLYSMAWPLTDTENLDLVRVILTWIEDLQDRIKSNDRFKAEVDIGELYLKSGNRALAKQAFLRSLKLAVKQPQAANLEKVLSFKISRKEAVFHY